VTTATLSDSFAIAAAAPGQLIGNYKLICESGRGGMGAVYLAERADEQYHKQVANHPSKARTTASKVICCKIDVARFRR
jgi:serine/threonine-protein kinase